MQVSPRIYEQFSPHLITNTTRAGVDKDDQEALHKTFFLGGNSSNRGHICSRHFEVYCKKCKAQDITINFRAIPKRMWEAEEAAAAKLSKVGGKETLERHFAKQVKREFTWQGILHVVAQFITCDNQVRHMCANYLDSDQILIDCFCRPWQQRIKSPFRTSW